MACAGIAENGTARCRKGYSLGSESVVLCRVLAQHIVQDVHEPVVGDERARRRRKLGSRTDGRGCRWCGSIEVAE